jgi:hypothetical protein
MRKSDTINGISLHFNADDLRPIGAEELAVIQDRAERVRRRVEFGLGAQDSRLKLSATSVPLVSSEHGVRS